MRVLVLVDFCDLFDFDEMGMFATFWEDIGVTEDSEIPGLPVEAVFPDSAACGCGG